MIEVDVNRLEKYSEEGAVQLGRLMRCLSERFTGEPIDEGLLEAIIDSPIIIN